MTGAHEEAKAKKSAKNIFADVVVAICLVVALVITAHVLWEYHKLQTPIPAGVLAELIRFWGGELLFIVLRQIFGSDAVTKAIAAKNTYNNTGGSI